MLNPFATLRHLLKLLAPQSQQHSQSQLHSYSQQQLINLLFHQRQCPHCNATDTLTVVPESEAEAFVFDLSCSACATEYEVRPTPPWYEYPQEIKIRATCDRLYTLQSGTSPLNAVESRSLQPTFNTIFLG